MFRNYLVTALRNIARHKLHSFINIAGLAVGLACVIFVLLFIRDELSYDKWIPGTQNLYRIEKTSHPLARDPLEMARLPFPLAAAMRDNIPEVAAIVRLYYPDMTLFAGDRQFREHVASVDPDFFQVIRLPLVKGDPASVFRDPESVVLSESAARKYFGTPDAIGKVIRTTANCELVSDIVACQGRLVPLKVTGIMRDIPHNSHLDGDVFLPNTSITDRMGQRVKQAWFSASVFSYALLAPGARPETVVAKMGPLLDRDVPRDPGDNRTGSQRWTMHLTPFTDVHLTSGRWGYNEKPSGSRTTLYGVGIVGLLILFVACFNFTNLATAQASLRAREIALRKTHGANRSHLIAQFLGEAVLTALLSLVIALALVEILQPAFARLLQHPIALPYDAAWLSLLILIAVLAGLLSGAYPALVLSGFRPSTILRTGNTGHAASGGLQTVLVVLQFAVSIGLGIAVMVVFGQISFARNIDLGIAKDNLLVVNGNGLLPLDGSASFVQRLKSDPGILDVAMTEAVPFGTYGVGLTTAQLPGHADMIALNQLTIGTHAAELLGMRLVAGRYLSDKRAQDQFDPHDDSATGADYNILIDQTAAATIGFSPQQAVGKTIILGNDHAHVVGVLTNVKFGGAQERARPTMYIYDPHDLNGAVLVRLRPGTEQQTLSFIYRAWHDFAPTKATTHFFMTDVLGKQYGADEREGELFGVFVVIAIFISCLGLFGLAAFTAGRRTREIGIRKVFGARTRELVFLLLWQFSVPVLIANLIAWPLAWYCLHDWLQGFAYRIALSPLYFASAGLAALLIAWATILAHALRVAGANPIHALRYE
ncbi:MAG TPA: ABC transporter permease [Rhizomicrobium sp.]|jgi:putative ABC transport system permease protein|nr:ABC transporter permease [Rhizomicrobium sp.]